jgi:hypothetical protein
MGILDLAVGMHVYRMAAQEGMLVNVDDFFPQTDGSSDAA